MTIKEDLEMRNEYHKIGNKYYYGSVNLTRAVKDILEEERARIIKLFREDSIYTGAVIKFEINNVGEQKK